MSVEKVKEALAGAGLLENYLEFDVSSATVELAAQAVGCEPGRIAKTLAFAGKDGPMLIVVKGTARVGNKRFKDVFHQRAKFPKVEDLPGLVGHPVGGVCPFAVKEGVKIYLDESLRDFDPVYPAAGAPNNAVKISLADLEKITGGEWINVTGE